VGFDENRVRWIVEPARTSRRVPVFLDGKQRATGVSFWSHGCFNVVSFGWTWVCFRAEGKRRRSVAKLPIGVRETEAFF
jgi:hypothetical protein